MTKEVIFFQGEEILNKLDERRVFGQELGKTQNKYIFSLLFQKKPKNDELIKIRSILSASELNFDPNIIFTPRVGTQSSWSSKAQDIFHNIGISSIKRVERFKAFKASAFRCGGGESTKSKTKKFVFIGPFVSFLVVFKLESISSGVL